MRRYGMIALCFLLVLILALPAGAGAEKAGKTVRVGWYESSFNTTDESGRRSGYAYEYQQKIAAYSGWQYEYVSAGWPVLLDMLKNGEIDLMSDVSWTEERENEMLFSSLPMGTEEYYLFISPTNQEILPGDVQTLQGKTVGVNRGSIQETFFREWAEKNGLSVKLAEVDGTESESLAMLENGELDAYVTVDSFTRPERTVPVYKIGSSDFFFAVNKERPDLQADLNQAMSRIQDENRYFNQQMFERFINRRGANAFLSEAEVGWLARKGTIRVGYQDNYMAFCAQDRETGELTGALKDYLDYASDCLVNAHLVFEPVAFRTTSEAIQALKQGEIDCVFPANLSSYDGERLGVVMTSPVTRTDMYAVVRQNEQNLFQNERSVTVAVNEGNPNYDSFLADHYPKWTRVYVKDTEACLEAVSKGVADCMVLSYYRYNNVSRLCERLKLTPVTTGINLEYCFAVRYGDTEMYSVLSKATGLVPESTLNVAMSNYITEDARLTLGDYLHDHLSAVVATGVIILTVILALLLLSLRSGRKAKQLIAATETDNLTGLYNRDFFFEYANRMRQEHPGQRMDAMVFNIEQFHSVNAIRGRQFGDRVLTALGDGIGEIARERSGIAGRFGADRFDLYCPHAEDWQTVYEQLQQKMDNLSPNSRIRLRMGVMPGEPGMEPVQMFDKARTACNMTRGSYKKHLIVYDEEAGKREETEQKLLNDLTRALNEYELEVYYQPKFNIQCDPPKLVTAEALVRWNHPELGLLQPGDFVPLFERNGRIAEIDRFVWNHAARKMMRWREEFGILLPVSVNLSRVDAFDPTLEKTLDGIIEYYGLTRDCLKLEITESVYTEDAEQLIRVVASLRRKGYQVDMDDFGSGYSSLHMLSEMPVDVLKMDRGFVRHVGESEKDDSVVSMILNIAKALGIPVIAEGVETEEQLKRLKELGCPIVQGYYFSKPLHSTEFENRFLVSHENRKTKE